MNRGAPPALLAFAACAALSPAFAVEAGLHTYAGIEASDGGSVYQVGSYGAAVSLDRDGLYGAATANASYGAVSVSALARAAADQRDVAIAAMAGAAMDDTFSIDLSPVPSPPPPPYPEPLVWSYDATVIVTGTPGMTTFETSSGGSTTHVALHEGENRFRATFAGLRQPIRIAFSVLVDTGSVGGAYQPSSAVEASVRWGGISGVRLGAFGPLPVQMTTTSASGYDWALAAPIPEPPLALMFGAGLTALALRRRLQPYRQGREVSKE